MSKTLHHLESYEWLGEFWREGVESDKFPGVLRYSATEGLTLTTMHRSWINEGDRAAKRLVIHGLSVDTGPITLFAAWSENQQMALNGPFSASEQRFVCTAGIFGAYYSSASKFSSCSVVFNNIAEFFHPQGFKNTTPFTREPLVSGSYSQPNPNGEGCSVFDIRVEMAATGYPTERVSSLLLIDEVAEGDLARAVDEAVDVVLKHHQKDLVLSRASLEHVVCVESQDDSGNEVQRYEGVLRDIQGLLSLLFLKMVRPIRLTIKPKSDEADRHSPNHPVLLSLWLTADQVDAIRRDTSQYFGLPIAQSALRDVFPDVLSRWSEFVTWPLNVVYPTLLTRLINPGNALQRYILNYASLEQCVYVESGNQRDESLSQFIDKNSTMTIREKFLNYLPSGTTSEQIAIRLREVRNCIVHPAKAGSKSSSDLVTIINSTALPNLSELIHIVLVSYVYEKIGLPSASIQEFRNRMHNHISQYEKVR